MAFCVKTKRAIDAADENAYTASYVEWFIEEAKTSLRTLIPRHRTDVEIMVIK